MPEESEVPPFTLNEAIQKAVSEYCVQNGGGFPVAMVCAVDWIDSDGAVALTVCEFDNQPTHRSLGLSAYLSEWFKDDAHQQWFACTTEDED